MVLQVGNFELKVKRSTAGQALGASLAAAPAQAAAAPTTPPTLMVLSKTPTETLRSMEETLDESTVPIYSPKVCKIKPTG